MCGRISLLVLTVTCLGITSAYADDRSGVISTSAKPIKRTAPRYPQSELQRNQQGWVKLSYVVTDKGDVIDPVVLDSSGSFAFERSARRVVRDWEYTPATRDGKAIQQCRTEVLISFAIKGSENKVSRRFYSSYRRIQKKIDKGELETAEPMIAKAFERRGLTMSESAWLWALTARLAGEKHDKKAQLQALRKATASSWLQDETLANLLLVRAALEIQSGHYSEALRIHERLEKLGTEAEQLATIEPYVEQIRSAAASPEVLAVQAEISDEAVCDTCRPSWKYKPLRRKLSIANVSGELDDIELRCQWKRFSAEAREGISWQIPDSWGDCSVIVFGQPGASFALVEEPTI